MEYRYRAVLEVLDGVPVAQVARQAGASRQAVYGWVGRYRVEGLAGLQDRSRRPHSSPTRVAAEVEAQICELRRLHPRWGPRRIAFELAQRGAGPGRTTVYRVLVRNGLVRPQPQQHKRVYRRWQRDAPMQLWQLDIMGGVFLADGRECKLVTGIDDHSRFVVIARVVVEPTSRAVCEAFTEAMGRYGVPSEVLTDNGKQFTGRFSKPYPAEVLFERLCRENAITARLTKPRSPTTTGKIERWHQTFRRDFLDEAGRFADVAAAQQAVDEWLIGYNYHRPHQSLGMVTPFSLFRPNHSATSQDTASQLLPVRPLDQLAPTPSTPNQATAPRQPLPPAASISEHDVQAVELEMLVSPAGRVVLPGNQDLKFRGLAGRTVTIWANDRSIHVLLGGELIRTRPSRLSPVDLATMVMRGARLAGPEPGAAALPRGPLPPATVVEVDRMVNRDGEIALGGHRVQIAAHLAGKQVTLRMDGHIMHVIADGLLAKTMPAPLPPAARARLAGARSTSDPLPPAPAQPPRAQRRVPHDGVVMVAGQRLRVGRSHAGKTVTVVIDDTVFRILHNDIELSTHHRKTTGPVTRFKAHVRQPRA